MDAPAVQPVEVLEVFHLRGERDGDGVGVIVHGDTANLVRVEHAVIMARIGRDGGVCEREGVTRHHAGILEQRQEIIELLAKVRDAVGRRRERGHIVNDASTRHLATLIKDELAADVGDLAALLGVVLGVVAHVEPPFDTKKGQRRARGPTLAE